MSIKIEVHIDDVGYKYKPTDEREVREINNRIACKKRTMTLETFSDAVGNQGHTFCVALFNDGIRGKAHFQQLRLLGVDIDGGTSYKEFLEISRHYEITPFLIYDTFSSTDKNERFRAVYLLDDTIKNLKVAEFFVKMLIQVFPGADTSCKDASRMFFGGKHVRYFSEKNRLNIENLLIAYNTEMYIKDSKNYNRNIQNFAMQHDIAYERGNMKIRRKDLGDKNKGIPSNAVIVGNMVIELDKEEYKQKILPVKHENMGENNEDIKTMDNYRRLSGITEDKLKLYCRLYKDHIEKDVHHDLKFMLATNLRFVRNGKSLFMKGVREKSKEKWKIAWKYITKNNYSPECCTKGCPYFNKCQVYALYFKLLWDIIPLANKKDYITMEEAHTQLNRYLDEAVNAEDKKIHLIKAQTALGKTQTYCEMAARKPDCSFMFVVPTVKLQEEIWNRLHKMNVQSIKTVSGIEIARKMKLSICEELEMLYKCGQGEKVKRKLQEYVLKHAKELSEVENNQLKMCLNQSQMLDGTCCVVTTHRMFLNLPVDILNKYEIIVDEDILMSIIKNNGSVPVVKIQEVLDKKIFKSAVEEQLKLLLNMKKDEVIKRERGRECSLSEENMKNYGEITMLLRNRIFCYDEESKEIRYFISQEVPNVKMIVLSATLNKKLWDDFCKNRECEIKEVGEVMYEGELKQYTHYSMSRTCIQENGYQKIKQQIAKITGKKDALIITFKGLKENPDIYFGKTEGFDEYKGQDIVVLGTPHYIMSLYKLVGTYLGYDAERKLTRQRVENSTYSFNLMTFKDFDMRNLQMYILESELEQAVGRARLLRYNATVWVFSNFPLRQAEINQEDYLKD